MKLIAKNGKLKNFDHGSSLAECFLSTTPTVHGRDICIIQTETYTSRTGSPWFLVEYIFKDEDFIPWSQS